MKLRRAVLGDAHVEKATASATPFDEDFQHYITENVWGEVWTRPGIDRRTRHIVTIAVLAALGQEHELEMHVRATLNTGVSMEELREVFLQVGVYAGVPAANRAFAIAKRVLAERAP